MRLVLYKGKTSSLKSLLEIWSQSVLLHKKRFGGGGEIKQNRIIERRETQREGLSLYAILAVLHHNLWYFPHRSPTNQHAHKYRYLYPGWLCKGTRLCIDILNKILQIFAPGFFTLPPGFVLCFNTKSPDFSIREVEIDDKHLAVIQSRSIPW